MKRDDIITVTLEAVLTDGKGIATVEDKIVIIDGCQPTDDSINVRIKRLGEEAIFAIKVAGIVTGAQGDTDGPYAMDGEDTEYVEDEGQEDDTEDI